MEKVLKISILTFLLTVTLSTISSSALRQIATKHVNLPVLSGPKTVAEYEKEDSSKLQYFMTAECTNNSSGKDQLVQVQTYRIATGNYSDFVDAPKNERIQLSNKHMYDVGYRLNAKVKDSIWNTVKFYGIWEIN